MSKAQKILIALRRAGRKGVTNKELSKIALRYGGCLGQLYKEGYLIQTIPINNEIYRYILVSEPDEPKVRKKAIDILLEEVELYGFVTRKELEEILVRKGIAVKFKANTYK